MTVDGGNCDSLRNCDEVNIDQCSLKRCTCFLEYRSMFLKGKVEFRYIGFNVIYKDIVH